MVSMKKAKCIKFQNLQYKVCGNVCMAAFDYVVMNIMNMILF